MSGRLTQLKIKSLSEPGRYSDGDGLYYVISKSLSRSWVLRIQAGRRRRDFGLGSAKHIALPEARKRALETRTAILAGNAPQASWRVPAGLTEPPKTFQQAAEECHTSVRQAWSNGKHSEQWLQTLRLYAFPSLGKLPVATLDAPTIIKAIAPIWHTKAETARRVKQRIGTVLDWSHARGDRGTEAPMRAIARGLGAQRSVKRHLAAMPAEDVPQVASDLFRKASTSSAALLFLIYTAARSGEVRGAKWTEIDLAKGLWTIPADRMKAGKAHVVPLVVDLIILLRKLEAGRSGTPDELVFPSVKGKPLTDVALSKALRSVYDDAATVHGFRSTFRDWAAESHPEYGDAVPEAALAHTDPNRVQAAYRRTNFLEQRRELMDHWADFVRAMPASELYGSAELLA